MTTPFRAFLTRDQSFVQMIKGDWRHRIPVADLPRWVRLYRELWSHRPGQSFSKADCKTPGPFAETYAAGVEALERIQKQVTT